MLKKEELEPDFWYIEHQLDQDLPLIALQDYLSL